MKIGNNNFVITVVPDFIGAKIGLLPSIIPHHNRDYYETLYCFYCKSI